MSALINGLRSLSNYCFGYFSNSSKKTNSKINIKINLPNNLEMPTEESLYTEKVIQYLKGDSTI